MTIVLPDAGRPAGVEADLVAGGGLPDYLDAVSRTGVDLTVPRWTFRSASGLADPLAALGIEPRSPRGRLLGDDPGDLPRPRGVLHQVYVAVDEAGTEAAAATAVVAGPPRRAGVLPWSWTARSCSWCTTWSTPPPVPGPGGRPAGVSRLSAAAPRLVTHPRSR